MKDSVGDVKGLVKDDVVRRVCEYFREPGQVGFSEEFVKKATGLVDIALTEEKEDPYTWCIFFDKSHPHMLEVGNAKDRLTNIFAMAQIYVKSRAEQATNQRPNRILDTSSRRNN